jgi:excinuclease ABC subunit A
MSEPKNIIIKNARVNNLKNISVTIPRNKFVVISGVSGSGKSSLAFDTIFAEGQRKYIESLSSYARQFLKRMDKPNVDFIEGLSPAIAVDQKRNNKNPRSTVGTLSEVYDYLKLLYFNIGKTISPISGNEVKKETPDDVLRFISGYDKEKYYISIKRTSTKQTFKRDLETLLNKGFTRIIIDNQFYTIESLLDKKKTHTTYNVLIDRGVVSSGDESFNFKIIEVCKEGFYEGGGRIEVSIINVNSREFSNKFELDGVSFIEPTLNLFSFNNPYGACSGCGGFGNVLGFDKIIPNEKLSLYSNCIAPWRTEKMKVWLKPLIENNKSLGVDIHKPYFELSETEKKIVWEGRENFKGINAFLSYLERKSYKIQYRIIASRYKGKTLCESCCGTGIREEAKNVKINNQNIIDIVLSPIDKILDFFQKIDLTENEKKLSNRALQEILSRLSYINDIGLGYLTLNRKVNTLSGGEFQRIKLATSLGSSLVGSLYVLDEPTVGLHPHNTKKLIEILHSLKEIGNTVIVVEHDEEVILSSDFLVDIGPGAGNNGGEIVFSGSTSTISNTTKGPTSEFIFNKKTFKNLDTRSFKKQLTLENAHENNLKNIDINIPLECLVVITGVSGSGKSTLIKQILYPAIAKRLDKKYENEGKYDSLGGDVDSLKDIEIVDQNPIGRSSRSNPATYSKAYDGIRKLFAQEGEKVDKQIKPSDFSFNVDGGRCEECLGEGVKKIEMQFMADLYLECDSCKGKRFKKNILEIKHKDKNIFDVLELTIEEAISFFSTNTAILKKLKPMSDVGLGYLKLGQSSSTLSGGEAQRLKLASYLIEEKSSQNDTLFIFDEPTSGLHNKDISYFMSSISRLIDMGNSVIIIEHNTELIKQADWIIDMGPDGGDNGGEICYQGTPTSLIKIKNNKTAKYLKNQFVKY